MMGERERGERRASVRRSGPRLRALGCRAYPGGSPRVYLPVAAWLTATALAGSTPELHAEEVFADVTRRAGLDVVHVHGARGKKHLPETIHGGAGWIDADGDGLLDLYLVQGHEDAALCHLPGTARDRIFRNRGNGTFEDITEASGTGDPRYGSGLAVGDIDNDGDSDLYVTNFGRNTLYLNLGGGKFRDITEEAGVGCPLWSSSAAFLDVDGDGLLDLYVANYLLYDPRVHAACTGNPRRIPAYCHPNKFDGAPDCLYLNRGGGRFEDVSKQAGIAVSGRILSKGLGVLPTDFDLDGDIDILVANDSVPNYLWRNLGSVRFEDAALEAGVALNTRGEAEACMGVDGGDVHRDGRQDYFVTNFSEETDTLFAGQGDGFFDDVTLRSGLAGPTFLPLGFGTRLFDLDLDGDLDIYVARGHILDNIDELHPGTRMTYAQPDQLFENDGAGRFKDVSTAKGKWFREALVGRALATADFDSDGDLDLFIVNSGQRCVLLENRSRELRRNHWLGLELEGNGLSNRDAYGARVRVETPPRPIEIEVRSAQSYLAANDPRVLIGLGPDLARVSRVRVRWPDGLEEDFLDLAGDRYHRLVRGSGLKAGSR